ncbi:MAG TPA: site-specific integrase [Myxococcota bacterium]|nr:site-specific integrase [Myxococcota bacterium]
MNRICKSLGSGALLDRITEKEIEDYRGRGLRAGLKDSSINTNLARFRAFMSWCVRMKMITARPHISTPAQDNGRKRFLSESEARRLLAAAKNLPGVGRVLADYLTILIFTGMRRTEGLELRWSWIDLGRNEINLPAEYSKNKHHRTIPMAPDVAEVLRRRRGLAVPGCPHVFVDRDKRLTDGRAEWGFWKARAQAGLDRTVTFHTMRHTCASWLTMKGVDIVTVAQILGHRDLSQTRRYSHLSDAHLQNAVKAISMMSPPAGSTEGTRENETETDDCQGVARAKNVIAFPLKTGS